MQWLAIFQKELLLYWRNKKFIWVPLVIMLLAVMDMLTYYFLPEIIELSGGMPEGTNFEAPELSTLEALKLSLTSLSTYGVLVIALATMGLLSAEIKSGEAEIILTKPIRAINYLSAKWAAAISLSLSSLFLGLLLAWYYVFILFDGISFISFLWMFCFFSLWFIFVLALVLFYNTILRNGLGITAATIGTLAILSLVNSAIGHKLTLFPNQLSNYIFEMLMTEKIPKSLWGTSAIIITCIILLFLFSHYIFKNKEVIK